MDKQRLPGWLEHVGMQDRLLAPGKVACRLQTDARHQNIQGVVHGSVSMAVLDTAMGHALDSLLEPGQFCSTTQISVQYLRAARPGDLLEAVGQVTHRGRSVAFLEGELRGGDGSLLARAQGTWHVGQRRS
ncbi:MAG: PaaI family thioesterase [Planctomycetia bacterium]